MAQVCILCGKRRGTRYCPALGGYICSRCCGEKRLVEIPCPPDCPYLKQHEAFQQEKSKAHYREVWMRVNADIKNDPDKFFVVFMVQRAVRYAAEKLPELTDRDVAAGLSDVDRRLSPIELIDRPVSPCGNLMWEFISAFMEERHIPRERVRDGVQRMAQVCAELSDPHAPRAFLHGLLGWMKEISSDEEERPSSLIITPDHLR